MVLDGAVCSILAALSPSGLVGRGGCVPRVRVRGRVQGDFHMTVCGITTMTRESDENRAVFRDQISFSQKRAYMGGPR